MRGLWVIIAAFAAFVSASPAAADDGWFPHPADAAWTYQWSDSVYAPTPTTEGVTVRSTTGPQFVLAWTTADQGNGDGSVSSAGTVSFQETNSGIVNTDWASTPPPSTFPVLCPQILNCGNALSSTLYNLIWGGRQPLLAEPLLKGFSWPSAGGAANDVSSISQYLGRQPVTVPAFATPVTAAVVRSTITQAGALGDPYGSGTRTTWWVYGVGPVKIEFDHAGGSGAAVTTAVLQTTTLMPTAAPNDVDYFPLTKGATTTYRWTNTKHLAKPELQTFSIDAVLNNTARFTLKTLSGPIQAAGSYGFSRRLDGVTNLWGTTTSSTRAVFPALGPRSAGPARRNRFASVFDLMDFGLNPILTGYVNVGDSWRSKQPSSTYATYGVNGSSHVVGFQSVKVPGGTFRALVVRSTLKQPGFPFGSGTRTSWFAPAKGLVKLTFAHGDGSVSTVELTR